MANQITNNFIREESSEFGSAITSKKSLKDYFIKKKKKTRSGSRSSRDSDNNYNDPLI